MKVLLVLAVVALMGAIASAGAISRSFSYLIHSKSIFCAQYSTFDALRTGEPVCVLLFWPVFSVAPLCRLSKIGAWC